MAKTTRREFLKRAALTGAAVSGLPAVVGAAEKIAGDGKSRVVISTDRAVFTNDQIASDVLGSMLDESIARLTNSRSGIEGWKKLFRPNDVIGLKVNCLFGKGVSTRPEMAKAVAKRLTSAGVKEENIIIWDRSTNDLIKCGFTPNREATGVQCYGDDGQWGELIEQGSFKGRITRIISEKVTGYINLPVLKTHGISGISCCLKNHYGSFDNPGSHHGNHCDPPLADFSSIPAVKSKCRLVIVDAIRPQYDGGPGLQPDAQYNYYTIMMSRDPVAADAHGLEVIQKKRSQVGLEPIPNEKTRWLQSAQRRGVGVCDPSKIELLTA